MGVEGLERFVQEQRPAKGGILREMPGQYIVVDAIPLFRLLSPSGDTVFGGAYAEVLTRTLKFVESLRQEAKEPILVVDGAVNVAAISEWESRKHKEARELQRLLSEVQAGRLWPDRRRAQGGAWHLPPLFKHALVAAFREAGARVHIASHEADAEIARLARRLCVETQGGCCGILGHDSDFFILDVSVPYLRLDSLPAVSMIASTGKGKSRMRREADPLYVEYHEPGVLAELLHMRQELLPLFAAVVGCDVTRDVPGFDRVPRGVRDDAKGGRANEFRAVAEAIHSYSNVPDGVASVLNNFCLAYGLPEETVKEAFLSYGAAYGLGIAKVPSTLWCEEISTLGVPLAQNLWRGGVRLYGPAPSCNEVHPAEVVQDVLKRSIAVLQQSAPLLGDTCHDSWELVCIPVMGTTSERPVTTRRSLTPMCGCGLDKGLAEMRSDRSLRFGRLGVLGALGLLHDTSSAWTTDMLKILNAPGDFPLLILSILALRQTCVSNSCGGAISVEVLRFILLQGLLTVLSFSADEKLINKRQQIANRTHEYGSFHTTPVLFAIAVFLEMIRLVADVSEIMLGMHAPICRPWCIFNDELAFAMLSIHPQDFPALLSHSLDDLQKKQGRMAVDFVKTCFSLLDVEYRAHGQVDQVLDKWAELCKASRSEDAWSMNAAPLPLPWRLSFPGQGNVGVYFGSFDPVHENHIRMVQHALRFGYVDHCVLVPNLSNPEKDSAPLHARGEMLEVRLRVERDRRLSLYVPEADRNDQTNWRGRRETCTAIKEQFGANCAVQLIGQDSFEKSVQSVRRPGEGILSVERSDGWKLLLFPRLEEHYGDAITPEDRKASQKRTTVPKALQRKVVVCESYRDAVELSSTKVRGMLRDGGIVSPKLLHPDVTELARRIYGRQAVQLSDVAAFYGAQANTLTTRLHRATAMGVHARNFVNLVKAAVNSLAFDDLTRMLPLSTVESEHRAHRYQVLACLDLCSGRGGDQPKLMADAEKHRVQLLYVSCDLSVGALREGITRLAEISDAPLPLYGARFVAADVTLEDLHFSGSTAAITLSECGTSMNSNAAVKPAVYLSDVPVEWDARKLKSVCAEQGLWRLSYISILEPKVFTGTKAAIINFATAQAADEAIKRLKGLSVKTREGDKFIGARFANRPAKMPRDRTTQNEPACELKYQLVTCHMGIHYAFCDRSSVKCFFQNAIGRLCSGGYFVVTTVDAQELLRRINKELSEVEQSSHELASPLAFGNALYQVRFGSTAEAKRAVNVIESESSVGAAYKFTLRGDGNQPLVDCVEYVVPPAALRAAAAEWGLEQVGAWKFSELAMQLSEGNCPTSLRGSPLAERIQELSGKYDRHGGASNLSVEESEVVGLYSAFVFQRRSHGRVVQDMLENVADAVTRMSTWAMEHELRSMHRQEIRWIAPVVLNAQVEPKQFIEEDSVLRVMPGLGAGLTLEWCANGYLVTDLTPEARECQQLERGDTIIEIGGRSLRALHDEDAIEKIFGSEFCDGAHLRVRRAQVSSLQSNVSCSIPFLFIFGGPGSGKSTLGAHLESAMNCRWQHVSNGDIFRAVEATSVKWSTRLNAEILRLVAQQLSENGVQGASIDGMSLPMVRRLQVEAGLKVAGCVCLDCPRSLMLHRLQQRPARPGERSEQRTTEALEQRVARWEEEGGASTILKEARRFGFEVICIGHAPEDIPATTWAETVVSQISETWSEFRYMDCSAIEPSHGEVSREIQWAAFARKAENTLAECGDTAMTRQAVEVKPQMESDVVGSIRKNKEKGCAIVLLKVATVRTAAIEQHIHHINGVTCEVKPHRDKSGNEAPSEVFIAWGRRVEKVTPLEESQLMVYFEALAERNVCATLRSSTALVGLPSETTEVYRIEVTRGTVRHEVSASKLHLLSIAHESERTALLRNASWCPVADIEALWAEKGRLEAFLTNGGLRAERTYFLLLQELFPSAGGGAELAGLGNRAGDKLNEIMNAAGLLSNADKLVDELSPFLDVCGGPGAWSQLILQMLEPHWPQHSDKLKGCGISLDRQGSSLAERAAQIARHHPHSAQLRELAAAIEADGGMADVLGVTAAALDDALSPALFRFEERRVLAPHWPRAPYLSRAADGGGVGAHRSTVHWGQLKLFEIELRFLTDLGRHPGFEHLGVAAAENVDREKDPLLLLVYAGAGPGQHLVALARRFPSVCFQLYDPRGFDAGLIAWSEQHPKRMCLKDVLFDDATARSVAQKRRLDGTKGPCLQLAFVSDIRTGDPDSMEEAEVEARVAEDMDRQRRWYDVLCPDAALLKFRPRWTQGSTCLIPGSQIILQAFAPQSSTETRLVVMPKPSTMPAKEIDNRTYEEQLMWHNLVSRAAVFECAVAGKAIVKGFDGTFDCAALEQTIHDFLLLRQERDTGLVCFPLRVVSEGGAGLTLEWSEGGYVVSDLTPEGSAVQQLERGDTIIEINGCCLQGLTEDEIEDRFGSEFHDGALLRVQRPHTGYSSTQPCAASKTVPVSALVDEIQRVLAEVHGRQTPSPLEIAANMPRRHTTKDAWYPELLARDDWKALWGSTGNGDVTAPGTAQHCASELDTFGAQPRLVVADGGFKISGSGNAISHQELFHARLFVAELLLALSVLCPSGHYIMKLYDTFSDFSVSLLYIVARCFCECLIVKPRRSRLTNSERYVVGRGFRGRSVAEVREMIDILHKALEGMSVASETVPQRIIDPACLMMDDAFASSVRSMCQALRIRQIEGLRAVLAQLQQAMEPSPATKPTPAIEETRQTEHQPQQLDEKKQEDPKAKQMVAMERRSRGDTAALGVRSEQDHEVRVDPEDGEKRTWEELLRWYAGKYSPAEIEAYWYDYCKPPPRHRPKKETRRF